MNSSTIHIRNNLKNSSKNFSRHFFLEDFFLIKYLKDALEKTGVFGRIPGEIFLGIPNKKN